MFDKKERDRIWRQNNKDKILRYNNSKERKTKESNRGKIKRPIKLKKSVEELKDDYVIHVMKNRTGIKKAIIRQYPEWVEAYRQQIKLKRLIKTKKNASKTTN